MSNKDKKWFKRLSKAEIVCDDICWVSLGTDIKATEKNKEWIINFVKENDLNEKLKIARKTGKSVIPLYYDALDLPRDIKLLEKNLIDYLEKSIDDLEGVVGSTDTSYYETGKGRIDIIIKKNNK